MSRKTYILVGMIEFKYLNSNEEAAPPVVEYAILPSKLALKNYKEAKLIEVTNKYKLDYDNVAVYANFTDNLTREEAFKMAESDSLSINKEADQ